MDARYYTTPLGALTGLVLARKLVPEKDRNVFNQGAGAAAGGALGYMGGGHLNEYLEEPAAGDTAGRLSLDTKRFGERGPDYREDPTEQDLSNTMQSLPDKYRHTKDYGLKGKRQGELNRLMQHKHYGALNSARAVNMAKSDPANAERWTQAASYWKSYADQAASDIKDTGGGLNRLLNLLPVR